MPCPRTTRQATPEPAPTPRHETPAPSRTRTPAQRPYLDLTWHSAGRHPLVEPAPTVLPHLTHPEAPQPRQGSPTCDPTRASRGRRRWPADTR
jgi:hypothetical protein